MPCAISYCSNLKSGVCLSLPDLIFDSPDESVALLCASRFPIEGVFY